MFYEKNILNLVGPEIAYFSMEVGLKADVHTYSGGLGVLAGDTLKAMADLNLPAVCVSLIHRKGYFKQVISEDGSQSEMDDNWEPSDHMELLAHKLSIKLDGRDVFFQAWRYNIQGVDGHIVPAFFLDTNVAENNDEDRGLTNHLYGGDQRYRLKQEAILGIGGVRLLQVLGYRIKIHHLNEGHACFLILELLKIHHWEEDNIKKKCVFTTHTPVAAGHDCFPLDMVREVINQDEFPLDKYSKYLNSDSEFNTTIFSLNLCKKANAVAQQHAFVSNGMFPGYDILGVTNGVHSATWANDHMARIFDQEIPEWRKNSFYLRYAMALSDDEMFEAHKNAKQDLFTHIKNIQGVELDPEIFTLGFARRVTGYKRADLFFRDTKRLTEVIKNAGKLQIIYAGKAHPNDGHGKDLIRRIFQLKKELKDSLNIVFLEGYDMALARMLVSGVDVWLNTPEQPLEASGTSGMKAALNGVPNFSVLDGWWMEGHIENVTGWSIGPNPDHHGKKIKNDPDRDARDIYNKLEYIILPKYYQNQNEWIDMMKQAIALNASFFSTYRMVMQYITLVYMH